MIKVDVKVSEYREHRLRALARGNALTAPVPRPGREALYARASALVGAFEDPDGTVDLSEQHDRYLYKP